jgi:methylglutaconyl-CoA hydratase
MDRERLACDGGADHAHLLVECPPKLAVNIFKGMSSRMLRRERGDLAARYWKQGVPWSPSYFAARSATMSAVTTSGRVLLDIDARGVATLVLNRPEVNNAYDHELITGLLAALDELERREHLRAVILKGNGRHFQAGADLTWIDAVRQLSAEDNLSASRATAVAVQRLNHAPVPTIALVQGGCFGGGTGIIAACDIVIAASDAMFSITEVRFGLTAAIIVPQLADAIGVRQLRRYALTGERFDAAQAQRIGLVHEVVPRSELESAAARILGHLLENGPSALAETKAHILACAWADLDATQFDALIESHAQKRQSAEAAEGLASFAQKRAARWAPVKTSALPPSQGLK